MKAYADIIEERERLKRELAEAKAMLGFHNRRGKSSEKKRKLNKEIQEKNNTKASKKCKASETTSKKIKKSASHVAGIKASETNSEKTKQSASDVVDVSIQKITKTSGNVASLGSKSKAKNNTQSTSSSRKAMEYRPKKTSRKREDKAMEYHPKKTSRKREDNSPKKCSWNHEDWTHHFQPENVTAWFAEGNYLHNVQCGQCRCRIVDSIKRLQRERQENPMAQPYKFGEVMPTVTRPAWTCKNRIHQVCKYCLCHECYSSSTAKVNTRNLRRRS